MKKVMQRIMMGVFITIGLSFAANLVIIVASNPGNIQNGASPIDVKNFKNNVQMVSYDKLRSGGIGVVGWNSNSVAYVNMVDEQNVIYIDHSRVNNFSEKSFLYQHELAHIHQKEAVAEASGGYPSVANPWQSFKYYKNLYSFNKQLVEIMPEVNENSKAWFMNDGFEAAAECYAMGSKDAVKHLSKSDTKLYKADYLVDDSCDKEQLEAVYSTWRVDEESGDWVTVETK